MLVKLTQKYLSVSASLTQIDASGTETEGGEKNSADADNLVVVPSLFVEYGFGDISVGLDYIPLSADVSKNTKSRTDVETSVTGNAATVTRLELIKLRQS